MSYVQVRFPDRLQNNSMLPCHATNKKKACISMDRQQEPIGKKLVLEFFVKIIYATPLVYVFSFFILHQPPCLSSTVPQRLALINHSYFN